MTRGGHKESRDEPERKCIVSGESQPKAGLIRFVLGPEDMIVPDIQGRLPGRGIYVSADREALAKASKKNLFSRAARQPVKVPDDLPELVERLLVQRVIDLISLGRKAGDAICGYEKVKDWLIKGQAPYSRGNGFGIQSRTCDTRRACGWWTQQPCCRGSGKACRPAWGR